MLFLGSEMNENISNLFVECNMKEYFRFCRRKQR